MLQQLLPALHTKEIDALPDFLHFPKLVIFGKSRFLVKEKKNSRYMSKNYMKIFLLARYDSLKNHLTEKHSVTDNPNTRLPYIKNPPIKYNV